MTYTVDRPDMMAALKDSYARQVKFTEIMCAGDGNRPEFKESNVKRAGGKFATREEKAKMAEDEAAEKTATMAAAEPGLVEFSDGTTTYKLSPGQAKEFDAAMSKMGEKLGEALKTAGTDPVKTVSEAFKAAAELTSSAMAIAKEVKSGAAEASNVLAEKAAPAKAQAAAQVTKAVADNMSDDQVKKGLVTVTKQLNSGEPSTPEMVMNTVKEWAAQAQKNIDSGIKAIKSAGSDAKAKALAAGTGLMTKIAEMAAAAKNSDAGKAIGDAANAVGSAASSVGKAIGDKVEEAGFSRNIKDLGGDLTQVGKDIIIDARQTVKRAEIGIKDAKKGTLKTLGNAASSASKAVGDAASSVKNSDAGKAVGNAANSAGKAISDGVSDATQVGKDLVIDARQTAKRAEIGIKDAKKGTLKTLGNAASSAGKAVGDKVEEAGFSRNIKDLPGDLSQVGKDLGIDARQTAKRAEIGIKDAKKSTLKTLGNAANSAGKALTSPEAKEMASAAAIGFGTTAIPRLAGGAIGGLVAGPAGALAGSQLGGAFGAGAAIGNVATGLKRQDPAYYTKEAEAVGNLAKGGVKNVANAGKAVGSSLSKLGDAANSLKDKTGKAVGDKAEAAGFSRNIKDLPRDVGQVGKDLAQDAKETASRAKDTAGAYAAGGVKNVTNAKNSAMKTLGDAANSIKEKGSKALGIQSAEERREKQEKARAATRLA
jgi:hypothetical protein